jgi:CRISPR-associated endonuclease/helicase Cas3
MEQNSMGQHGPATNTSFIAHRRRSDNAEQAVADHLHSVSHWTGIHASKLRVQRAGELIGLLHDLGKYSLAFQRYLKSAEGIIDPDGDDYVDAKALKGKIDHSTAGAQYVWNELSTQGALGVYVGQMLALCIASHHSGLIDCISADSGRYGEDTFDRRMNKAGDKTHLEEVIQAADPAILARANELLNHRGLMDDLKALGGRIVANEKSRTAAQQQLGLMVRFLFSCLIDADRTDTGDFEHNRVRVFRQRGTYADWTTLADRLESYLNTLKSTHGIDTLRHDISRHCLEAATNPQGVYTLTVPTGGGKTLASLRFALHHAQLHNLDRILYVVPFTSIIDQNAEVVRDILERNKEEHGRIVLEHHSSLTPEQQSWREKILCENWDAPVVYTTMVQFLESLFGAGTRGARRMHQLANSVLVFDEVQTLPIKCTHLFNNAINFLVEHCNSTVILCTATQPLLHKVSAEKGAIRLSPRHEIMPDRRRLFDELKRVEVRDCRRPAAWTYEDVARLALDELGRGRSCLVIVNTKDAARSVYKLCTDRSNAERVHLSTDMCPAHRKEKLAYVRERLRDGLPVLCVSTQLIEAGVDVDFDVVIRFLAGLDSIAQAAGRCNRNGRAKQGVVYVVNPADEKLNNLPDIEKARDVGMRVLDDFRDNRTLYADNLFGPEAITDYYRHYFFERQEDMSYPVSAHEIGTADTLLNLFSSNSHAVAEYRRKVGNNPPLHFLQAFMTAANAFKTIDAPTRGVIVPFGNEGGCVISELCAAYEVEKQYELLKRAQQFTVNVFPHVLRKLSEAEAVHPIQKDVEILYLDERYYSDEYGLATEAVSTMGTLDV